METKAKLQIAAGAAGSLLVGSVVYGQYKKRQNHRAALFFSELERNIAPAAVGLVESDAFNMYYWQNLGPKLKKSYYLLKQNDAKTYAQRISDAWGWVDDDEDKIYSVFRALKDHVQVSQVAYWYYQDKKINLIDDLRSRLDKDEVGEILKIVNKLPPYRVAAK
jgi:hypothetical protein